MEYVDQTTAWKRPTGFPSARTKNIFSDVVDKNGQGHYEVSLELTFRSRSDTTLTELAVLDSCSAPSDHG